MLSDTLDELVAGDPDDDGPTDLRLLADACAFCGHDYASDDTIPRPTEAFVPPTLAAKFDEISDARDSLYVANDYQFHEVDAVLAVLTRHNNQFASKSDRLRWGGHPCPGVRLAYWSNPASGEYWYHDAKGIGDEPDFEVRRAIWDNWRLPFSLREPLREEFGSVGA